MAESAPHTEVAQTEDTTRRMGAFVFSAEQMAEKVATHITYDEFGNERRHRVLRAPLLEPAPERPYVARIPTKPLLP